MNLIKFLESFSDDKLYSSKGDRRDSFTQFKALGGNLAMAAAPLGLASFLFPQKANAASAAFMATAAETPIQALQLALTLEYLEDEFYRTALDTAGLIPTADQTTFMQIALHENKHVSFLQTALGANSIDRPDFDFTANGTFDTFTNYQTFLALAQAFEDTGVRAYKGQAANLMGDGATLTAALQIHSVEARHAAQVRRLRNQKGWIIGNSRDTLPEAAQPVYNGEEKTDQAGFNTAGVPNIPPTAGSESFDEPLTGAQATAIASLFITS